MPYAVTQENVGWTTLADGTLRIHQTLLVERESQKKMLIGSGGEVVKWIASAASAEMQEITNQRVDLLLQVKIRKRKG